MSGCQCQCGRRFVRTLAIYAVTYATFYTGNRIYQEGAKREAHKLLSETNALRKEFDVKMARVAAVRGQARRPAE